MEAKEAPTAKRNDISVVAEDKNWRSYIANELNCAERWHNDWGFLAAGAIEGKSIFQIPNILRNRDFIIIVHLAPIDIGATLRYQPIKPMIYLNFWLYDISSLIVPS